MHGVNKTTVLYGLRVDCLRGYLDSIFQFRGSPTGPTTHGVAVPKRTAFPTMLHWSSTITTFAYKLHTGPSGFLTWRPVAITAGSEKPIYFWSNSLNSRFFQLLGNIQRVDKATPVSLARKNLKVGGLGPAWRAFVLSSSRAPEVETPESCLCISSWICLVVKMSPWWGLRVWQKWIGAFAAWAALTAAHFPLPCFFCLMLESSVALCPELDASRCTETNMEKNPNNSTNTKVPPRSSSTGPATGETKVKTGDTPPAGMW